MLKLFSKIAILCFSLVLSVPSMATSWNVDLAQSKIEFSGTHAGNDFTGTFIDWKADIQFNPVNLELTKIKAVIATGSAETGNGLYDGTLKGEDWFHVKAYPEAVFESSTIKKLKDGQFEASGSLTIKKQTLPVTYVFDLAISGDTATAKFKLTLNRLSFGLGVQSDASASWVSEEIALDILVVAHK